jgi:Dolichyl-phosphate-mannose-protein mannosyltransferase
VTDKIQSHDRVVRGTWLAFAVLFIGLVIVIRLRLLGIPLERDEGEYAYAAQLILQGVPPYKLAYNMKFPGAYAAYAGIMSIFGQTITGIHLGLLLVNAATVGLIFFLGRRLANSTTGLAAASTYAILSVSPSVLGFAGHATHFVVLPVLGGALLLLNHWGRETLAKLLASGLLFGLGLLMKQPAIFFVLFGAVYLLCNDVKNRVGLKKMALRSLLFAVGALLPFVITGFLLWWAGVWDKFWFWTVSYALQYGGLIPLSQAPHVFADSIKEVIGPAWAIWMLAAIGLFAGLWDRHAHASTGFLVGLLASSALAVCPGFYFRYHYFILVLPAVSLLAGLAIGKLSELLASKPLMIRLVPLILLGAALSLPVVWEKRFFFMVSPVEASRSIYPESPFPESIKIAEYVREHTNQNDTIAVLGSEPQIYFYSNRHSATGYIYTYNLMEPQKYARQMQREMIHEIEFSQPKYLISVVMNDSWLHRAGSEPLIFAWAGEYTNRNYMVAGFVNITSDGSDYYFDQVPQSVAQLGNYILIYKRKS